MHYLFYLCVNYVDFSSQILIIVIQRNAHVFSIVRFTQVY